MANNIKNIKRRQKQLERKKKKRQLVRKSIITAFAQVKTAKGCAKYPIHECLIPENLFEIGIGVVVVSRKVPDGNIALSSFVVDVYCMGVKNAFFKIVDPYAYEDNYKTIIISNGESDLKNINPSCMKKLIIGAVEYAKNIGISPHHDYHKAKDLLLGINETLCPVSYKYGKDGKPLYISGPNETPKQIERILQKISDKSDVDNSNYIIDVTDDHDVR